MVRGIHTAAYRFHGLKSCLLSRFSVVGYSPAQLPISGGEVFRVRDHRPWGDIFLRVEERVFVRIDGDRDGTLFYYFIEKKEK